MAHFNAGGFCMSNTIIDDFSYWPWIIAFVSSGILSVMIESGVLNLNLFITEHIVIPIVTGALLAVLTVLIEVSASGSWAYEGVINVLNYIAKVAVVGAIVSFFGICAAALIYLKLLGKRRKDSQ
jgi:hypothetical protein